eukprot:symbB.v1.2.031719.t1/scaffold3714.1/size51563/6
MEFMDARSAMHRLQHLARTRKPEAARELLHQLQQGQLQPDRLHHNAVLMAHRRGGHWQHAAVLLWEMKEVDEALPFASVLKRKYLKFLVNAAQFQGHNAFLGVNAPWPLTLVMLGQMRMSSICGDAFSLTEALKSCRQSPWSLPLGLLADSSRNQVEANVLHFNEIMCNVEDRWRVGAQIFDDMQGTSVCDDLALRNTLRVLKKAPWPVALSLGIEDAIGTTAVLGNLGASWSATLGLLKTAKSHRLSDGICVNAAADSCLSGPWNVALHLGQESGDAFGFSTAINAAASSWPMSWQLLEVAQAIDAANDVLLFTHATHTRAHV